MFKTSEETKRKVYKMFDRNEKMVEDDVKIIKTWLKTQPHLPEIMEDVKIRNFLNLNKFSIEKTKRKIDMYYTIRSLIPELLEGGNPKLEDFKRFFDTMYMSTLPNALDDTHRVYFMKPKRANVLNFTAISNIWFATFEMRLYEDFMVDDIVFVDTSPATFNDYKTITPTVLTKVLAIYKKVYSLRLKNLIFLNCPPFISFLGQILKSVMSPKIFGRVQFHTDDAVLKEILPKDFLPKDYGGDGLSLDELNDMTQRKLQEYQDRFDKLDKLRVNEALRPEKLDNDDILGYYGNFKKIDVD